MAAEPLINSWTALVGVATFFIALAAVAEAWAAYQIHKVNKQLSHTTKAYAETTRAILEATKESTAVLKEDLLDRIRPEPWISISQISDRTLAQKEDEQIFGLSIHAGSNNCSGKVLQLSSFIKCPTHGEGHPQPPGMSEFKNLVFSPKSAPFRRVMIKSQCFPVNCAGYSWIHELRFEDRLGIRAYVLHQGLEEWVAEKIWDRPIKS